MASTLNKIIQNSHFKKMVSLEEQTAQKEDRFLRGRQIAYMAYDYFRVTDAHDTVLDYADFFTITRRNDNIQDFDTRWDEVLLSMLKIPSDDILESLYKLRIRESAQLKTVLELYHMEIHQKISMPNYQRLKNNGEKKHTSETSITKFRKQKVSVREETNAVSRTRVTIVPNRRQKALHALSHQHLRSLRGRRKSGKSNRQQCKNFLKGTCTKLPCDYWHPPGCQFSKSESVCEFGAECSFPHRKVNVSQNAEPPESVSISWKGPKVLGPIRRLRFTRAALRQANIRE